MNKSVLIVFAHPEPTSLTRQLVEEAEQTLRARGHEVILSDLYAMNWKAVFDAQDFPDRLDSQRLSFIAESGHAYASGQQMADVMVEQQKLLVADAIILAFPLWWFGMPAILKGWIDRVYAYGFAYGYQGEGNRYRYGEGRLKGKRALLLAITGGPAIDYSPRGINGPLEQLLYPITHGCLFYPGMDVLPTHAVHGAGRITSEKVAVEKRRWQMRLNQLFTETPIPFRPQNGGDYPDRHVLADQVAPGRTGLMAHIARDESGLTPAEFEAMDTPKR
jgi:NAD(P)H dehydrogenase (quinone)